MPPATPSTSTPLRPRADRMKDSILKESSAGWTNAVTPLRIAKRDQLSPSSSTNPIQNSMGATRVIARRSSNSYKHVFNNNLVSRSPFKSQLAPRQPTGGAGPLNTPRRVVPVARKVSGEKRPRSDSLIQQAEHESAQRVNELGFKRRQSKGFQGLVEKGPVSRSPFRQLMSPGKGGIACDDEQGEFSRHEEEDMSMPIAIKFPTKGDDATSPETTETESSLNSKESDTRPRTPPNRPSLSHFSPSPSFEKRSPGPSALQGSPARSSLVQKSRLLGPRSRSLSTGANASPIVEMPPRRERRKTVTFDERCDVVEFDRESCEDAVFDTDDEDVYGRAEPQQSQCEESSPETSEYFDAAALDDSINGLVDSMLKEAISHSEPSTPETNNASLSSIAMDLDLMTGGAEDGVPLGRTHHAERARAYQHHTVDLEPPSPATFPAEEISFSTPPRLENADPQTPRAFGTPTNSSFSRTPLPLPPDTEKAEDGMPLGRTHHADRAKAAHETREDIDVKMLPPSPTPANIGSRQGHENDLSDPLVPRFDLGIDNARTSSPRGSGRERRFSNDDVFSSTGETRNLLGELEFENPDIDADLLSNTSIASFHEFPPQEGSIYEEPYEENEHSYQRVRDISFGRRSDRSLDAIVSNLRLREDYIDSETRENTKATQVEDGNQANDPDEMTAEDMDGEGSMTQEREEEAMMRATPPVEQSESTDFGPHSPGFQDMNTRNELGSPGSLMGSDGRRSRSPRITREDVLRKLSRQRSSDNCDVHSMPALSSSTSSMSRIEERTKEDVEMDVDEMIALPLTPSQKEKPQPRPPLEERLKRALSPPLAAPVAVRPAASPFTPPIPLSPHAQVQRIPARERTTSSPPRVGHHGRAQTYDFDERPPSVPAKIVQSRSPMSSSFDFNQPGVDIADMDMRSALDRLVDDVSVAGGVDPATGGTNGRNTAEIDRSGATVSDGDVSMADTELITEESTELLASLRESLRDRPQVQRSGTAPPPALPATSTPERPPISRSGSEASMAVGTSAAALYRDNAPAFPESGVDREEQNSNVPPPLPPKTPEKSARKAREEMIREKRREARARESGEYFVPPRRDAAGKLLDESPASKRKSESRPIARRSLSTGDAEDLLSEPPTSQRRVSALRNRRGGVLGVALDDDDDMLSDSIQRELKKRDDPKKHKSYELRERDAVVYASSSQDNIKAQRSQSLEVEDKAWRTVRRPSDMDEYARQIKEIRAQEKPGKSHGKVFVKVLRIKGITVPIPPQQTIFTCTLNNGIHYVTTPECRLSRDAKIEQEFELIEHTKLEFSLTLKIRRDPHILKQFKAITPPALPSLAQPGPSTPSQHRGVRSFFGGTPKKPKTPKHARSQTDPLVRFVMEENLARYMKQDGTLARAFVAFKDIARHCDTRLFESTFPLVGQRLEAPGEGGGVGGTMAIKQIGEIVLQIFRLPPLPGIPQNQLPQSLDECHRGLRHISWHKVTYHEGVLTQLGGDCSTWRRRQLRVIGGNLVAFNDVTKRATATIDLKKAIAIEDDQDPKNSSNHRDVDDFDAMYGVERSFRLVFPHNQEITFFADTDEEKSRWLDVFRALVGHIPPHPLWAELLWQRLNEALKTTTQSSSAVPSKAR